MLTRRQLALIRSALRRGDTREAIGRRHGISARQVWNIEHARSYGPGMRRPGRPGPPRVDLEAPAPPPRRKRRRRKARRAAKSVKPKSVIEALREAAAKSVSTPEDGKPRQLVQLR